MGLRKEPYIFSFFLKKIKIQEFKNSYIFFKILCFLRSPTTTQPVWVQIKVKVESSDQEGSNKDQRVVKELYSAPGSENNPPKVRLRNPLFYFQSPCSVAHVDSTGATVLSQVACESNQNFECHKNPKSPERWNAEKINWENESHSETCKVLNQIN